jgi:transposase
MYRGRAIPGGIPPGIDKGKTTPGLSLQPDFRYFRDEQTNLKPGVATNMGIFRMYQADILLQQGLSRTSVAEALGVSRRTVYNYEHGIVFKDNCKRGRRKGQSKLAPFYPHIDAALKDDFTLNAEVLFDKLVLRGYTGRISIVRDYIRKKRLELHNLAVWRFETLPGQQAQVDWMNVGTVEEYGHTVKRYAFIMKFGYSRRSYVEFTTSMQQPVLFACMIHAFEHFGGVPAEILFDNMKTAWLYSLENSKWEPHPKMLAFAAHYSFTPRRCKVYRPKTKGKVEREVRYIRTSFLPSVATDIRKVPTQRLNELVEAWMERVDAKVIREFGQTRMDRFEQEKASLRTIPVNIYEYRLAEPLFVNREGKIIYKTNTYTVPADYRGKQLEGLLDLSNKTLMLRYDGEVVRTLTLKPAGAKEKTVDPADEREHREAWEMGRELEERIRLQIAEKRKRAKTETVTTDPAIYDHLFTCGHEIMIPEEVVV